MARQRLTNYGRNLVLDVLFGKTATVPDTLWLATITSTPVVADTGTTITEPEDDDYARLEIDNSAAGSFWEEAASGIKFNALGLTFEPATEAWASSGFYGLLDAETEGNLILFGEWSDPFLITEGQTLFFNPNDLAISALAPVQRDAS